MDLPSGVLELAPDLFESHPFSDSMNELVVMRTNFKVAQAVGETVCNLKVARNPHLVAGFWLYADDLEASHSISQNLSSVTGSWWHAVMHRREGDFANSRYWYRQARNHPLMATLGFDPHELVTLAESKSAQAVEWQRQEWAMLMDWSVQND